VGKTMVKEAGQTGFRFKSYGQGWGGIKFCQKGCFIKVMNKQTTGGSINIENYLD
jgi:hypothetical protein